MSAWNGNVDLTQIDAMMAVAVFNDDAEAYVQHPRIPVYFFLASDGPLLIGTDEEHGNVNHFWSDPFQWVDGLMLETCRDNGQHAQ